MKKLILSICVFACSALSAVSAVSAQEYRTVENLPYRTEGDPYALERCKLDVYYPEAGTGAEAGVGTDAKAGAGAKARPVVVWFHGGGLTGGERFIPEELKRGGLVVVAANYRLMPRATVAECIDDAAAAVAWTFRHAADYGGDSGRIYVAGHSAGGYLANMIGLDKQWLAAYGVDADEIAALVPFSGQAVSHYAYRETLGMRPDQPGIDRFAPLYHVRADAPPFVIVSGDREMELYGRYEETAYFWRMLRVVGHRRADLYELDGYDHGTMAAPAFHILKNRIRQDTQTAQTAQDAQDAQDAPAK